MEKPQVLVYIYKNPNTIASWKVDIAKIKFDSNKTISAINIIQLRNQLGKTIYYILDISMLFLFLLYNTDKLKVYFDNITNTIV